MVRLEIRATFGDNHRVEFSLKNDLKRLSELAYHRDEDSCETVEAFHRTRKKAAKHPDFHLLEKAYAWVLAPYCLWALDFHQLCELLQEQIAAGTPVEHDLRLLVNNLQPLPDEEAQKTAMAHEHAVRYGNYEPLVKSPQKFDAMQSKLCSDPDFQNAWQEIQAQFDIQELQKPKGIIRRRMITERNMRNDNAIRWDTEKGRFQVIFDAFCQRWNLYGMRYGKPLLLKISVNLTPFGTLIFVPAYSSLDFRRDLELKKISNLHKSRGVRKQGEKLALGFTERKKDAEKLVQLEQEALRLGLKGVKKQEFLFDGLGWVLGTSPKRLSRLRAEFKNFWTDKTPV